MDTASGALPDGSVLIHIGPHKTGTTAIQAKLASARDELREHGVLYPGPGGAHHAQARALTGRAEGFADDAVPLAPKAWLRLARTVREAPGTVVLSSEFFSLATAEHRAQLVAQIDPSRIQVLIGARNPGLIALSNWQQSLRSGVSSGTVEEFLRERFYREVAGEGGTEFWRTADAAALAAAWSDVVPNDRIHVVAIDESDRRLLPATFERLLGLPENLLVDQPIDAHNRSLTAPEAEVLRSTRLLLADDLPWAEFSLFFRQGMGRELLYTREPAPGELRSALPAWAADQSARETDAIIARLGASGVRIIGDLDHLRGPADPATPAPVALVPVELAAHAAAGIAKAAQQRIRKDQERLERLEAELAAARPRGLEQTPARELVRHLGRRLGHRVKRIFRRR